MPVRVSMRHGRLEWRVFPTVFKYSRKHLKKWLKPRLVSSTKKPSGCASEDDTRPHKSPDSALRSVVLAVQRGLRKAHTKVESKKKGDLATKVCALLTTKGAAGLYTPIKLRRSPRRASPSSVGSTASGHTGPGSIAGPSGRKGASKAPSSAFGGGHSMGNSRTRMAFRKEKKKQAAEGASKSQSHEKGPRKKPRKRPLMAKAGS